MDGELGGIERAAFAQILARRHHFVPRLQRSHFLQSQPFLAREQTLGPAPVLGSRWIQSGQRLRQDPELRLSTRALVHQKPPQRITAPHREEEHALVETIQHGGAGLLRDHHGPGRIHVFGCLLQARQIELFILLPPCLDVDGLVLPEEMGSPVGNARSSACSPWTATTLPSSSRWTPRP